MVMKPNKHQRRKHRCQGLCLKVHNHAQSLAVAHTLRIDYVVKDFYWFVPPLEVNSYCVLCMVKAKQKHTTKKNIVGLHNHFPLLTMTPVKSPYINDPKILSKFSFVASQYISQDDAGFLCNRVFFTGTRSDQQNSMWTQLSSQTWQHADHPDCG